MMKEEEEEEEEEQSVLAGMMRSEMAHHEPKVIQDQGPIRKRKRQRERERREATLTTCGLLSCEWDECG